MKKFNFGLPIRIYRISTVIFLVLRNIIVILKAKSNILFHLYKQKQVFFNDLDLLEVKINLQLAAFWRNLSAVSFPKYFSIR